MPLSLIPARLFQHYRDVTPEMLRQAGITLLLSDLDFTLAPKSVRRPDPALRAWIAEMKEAGIQVMIVSNNRSGQRVTEFCADLGIPFQGHAGKPSTRGLEAAMARAGADRTHTAMLGDKLLTDMLAAEEEREAAKEDQKQNAAADFQDAVNRVLGEKFALGD